MHMLRNLKDRVCVAQLEAATKDVEGQLQPESRKLLKELYKVARYEERYLNGEIGPSRRWRRNSVAPRPC